MKKMKKKMTNWEKYQTDRQTDDEEILTDDVDFIGPLP